MYVDCILETFAPILVLPFSFCLILHTLTVGKVKNCMLLLFNHLGNFDLGQVFYSNDKANGAHGSVVLGVRSVAKGSWFSISTILVIWCCVLCPYKQSTLFTTSCFQSTQLQLGTLLGVQPAMDWFWIHPGVYRHWALTL